MQRFISVSDTNQRVTAREIWFGFFATLPPPHPIIFLFPPFANTNLILKSDFEMCSYGASLIIAGSKVPWIRCVIDHEYLNCADSAIKISE